MEKVGEPEDSSNTGEDDVAAHVVGHPLGLLDRAEKLHSRHNTFYQPRTYKSQAGEEKDTRWVVRVSSTLWGWAEAAYTRAIGCIENEILMLVFYVETVEGAD